MVAPCKLNRQGLNLLAYASLALHTTEGQLVPGYMTRKRLGILGSMVRPLLDLLHPSFTLPSPSYVAMVCLSILQLVW